MTRVMMAIVTACSLLGSAQTQEPRIPDDAAITAILVALAKLQQGVFPYACEQFPERDRCQKPRRPLMAATQ